MASADRVAGGRDEMGQIESDAPYSSPIQEEGTGGDVIVSTSHTLPFPLVTQPSFALESRIEEKVKEVVGSMKSQKDDELEKLRKEKELTDIALKLKEDELRITKEKYEFELRKKDEESAQKLAEKDEELKKQKQIIQQQNEKIEELTLLNKKLEEEVESLNARNKELQTTISSLEKQIRQLNQSVTDVQNENAEIKQEIEQSIKQEDLNKSLHDSEEKTMSMVNEKIDYEVKKRLAELLSSMQLNVQMAVPAPDVHKQQEYKAHQVSPSRSPNRSPVNVPYTGNGNNLDV